MKIPLPSVHGRLSFLFALSIFMANGLQNDFATAEEYDVCVYGGTSAGVIAAIEAAQSGKSVVLVEPGRHLGGMSVEGLGGTDIDNHPFQNSFAVGGLTKEFYRRVSVKYGREARFNAALLRRAKNTEIWRFEPHVAEAVWDEWIKEVDVQVNRSARLAERHGIVKRDTRIESIRTEDGREFKAKVFIDATYEGDLLAKADVSFFVGREGNKQYGETKNGVRVTTRHSVFDRKVDPFVIAGDKSSGLILGVENAPIGMDGDPSDAIQGYCFRLCLTKTPSNRVFIAKPESYDPTNYELQRRYIKAGGEITVPRSGIPNEKTDPGSWHHLAGNLTGWNHYWNTASYAERASMLERGRDYIQGLYWFMAHDPAVPEHIRREWGEWGLARDEFVDNGHWPRQFYVRNGRRMIGDYVMTEAHGRKENPVPVIDPVGLVWWPHDLHNARRLVKEGLVWNEGAVFNEADDWIPFGISYQSLVPKRSECENLLSPTCPSSSYVAYGAYRIEFTFMTAAQSSAVAAVLAIENELAVQDVPYSELRAQLLDRGQVLEWDQSSVPSGR